MSIKYSMQTWESIEKSTERVLYAIVAFVVVAFLYDYFDIDKILNLDSDWPTIVLGAISAIAAIGIGVASLKQASRHE